MKFVRALVAAAGLLLAVTFVPGAAAQGAPTVPPNTRGADYQRFAKLTFIAEHACDANTFERARETVSLLAFDARALVGKRLYPEAYRGHLGHGPAHGTPARARLVAQYKAWSDYIESVDKWQFHPKPPCKQISVPRFSTQTTPVKNYTIVLPDPGKKGSYTASVVDKATGRTFQSTHVSGPGLYNWYLFEGMLPDHVYQLRINGKLQAEFAPMDDGGMFDARKTVKHAAGPKVRIKGAARKPTSKHYVLPQTKHLKNYVIVLPDSPGPFTARIVDKETEDRIAEIHGSVHGFHWDVGGMVPDHAYQLQINGKTVAEFTPMKEGGTFDARKVEPKTYPLNHYVIVLPDKQGPYTASVVDKVTGKTFESTHVPGRGAYNWDLHGVLPGGVYQLRINGKVKAEFVPMKEGGFFDAAKENKQVKEKTRVERHRVKRQSKRHKAVELPTRNLSFEQQQVANAWYAELGKIKRKGLDAARRGDRRAVDSAIQRAAIVITDAKKGNDTLGTLPIVIRNQIAKEGRRVVKALSGRRGKPANVAPKHAAEREDSHVAYAITNFFVRLGPARTLPTAKRRPSRTKPRAAHSGSSGGARRDDEIAVFFGGLPLMSALFSTPPAEIEERQLRNAPIYYSKAQIALSRGPSASREPQEKFDSARSSLETLANPRFTRSARVRAIARLYLSRLPDHYAPGYAFTHHDGTVAADPDPFIRLMLARGGDLLLIRGGGPGEGAK